MDAGSVAALLTAFGVGGGIGALLRSEHERAAWFRERMIEEAEGFLADVGSARSALAEVSRAIDEPEEHVTEEEDGAVRAVVAAAEGAITRVDVRISPISVVFPHLRGREHPFEAAADVVIDLKAILRLLTETEVWGDGEREKLEEVRGRLSHDQGRFAGNASNQIWRRWYLLSNPYERARMFWHQRLRKRTGGTEAPSASSAPPEERSETSDGS
jgi:hypothetical protein